MGETRVDLQHLLEDLRDAYTGSLEETIVTEIVANSLDSGAASIRVTTDPAAATLTRFLAHWGESGKSSLFGGRKRHERRAVR